MTRSEKEQKIEYLSRCRRMNERIDRLLEEKARWRSLCVKVTQNLSQAPGKGGSGSPIERPMDKVLEIEEEISREIEELQTVRQEIWDTLGQLEDDTLRLLMEYRYIDGMTFEKIGLKMNYCCRQVVRKHEKALSLLKL